MGRVGCCGFFDWLRLGPADQSEARADNPRCGCPQYWKLECGPVALISWSWPNDSWPNLAGIRAEYMEMALATKDN